MQGHQERRLWAWDISALVYERAYIRVAHQTDDDLLVHFGPRVSGATVADCGCGPGVVSEKLLRAGASFVVALDTNAGMIDKARRRLAKSIADGHSVVAAMWRIKLCGKGTISDALTVLLTWISPHSL